MHSSSAVPVPSGRDRAVIWSSIVLVTALAWAYLVDLSREMSSSVDAATMMASMGMTTQAWDAGDLLFTFVMWAVMMVGMMTAAASPVLLLFAGTLASRPGGGTALAVLPFALGYLAVWLGFSAIAAAAQWALTQSGLFSSTMAASTPWLAGSILVAAGVYQLTPLKSTCLTHCRSPLGFLMGNWRDGARGALQMGSRHGAYCLGCCWALMGVLFVVGVMNLAWVAVLATVILIEKIGPHGVRLARLGGAILIVWGGLLIAT